VKHFSEQVWTDFVRGVGPTATNGQIEAHLASACSDCVASVGMWKKVYSIAASEPGFTPPDDAVRMVKLEFAAGQSPRLSPWTMAALVFDSLSQPLTASVRSGASESRQVAFEAEGTMVDLVLDTRPQSGTISLVGQVVDKGGAKIAPRQVAVIVWTETGQPLAETSANEFGEFQLEFPAQDRLRLSVEIAGHKPIRIPPMNLNSPDAMRSVT
jgi:hypothetical protein